MSAAGKWPGFFNPNDPKLWALGSDADWIYGDYIHDMISNDMMRETPAWMVRRERSAAKMVRDHSATVLAILGSLMAWRVLTVSQMQAGLAADADIPDFLRDIPTLWGAMTRLGLIDIGFSPRERVEGIEVNQVWVALGKNSKLVRRVGGILGDKVTGSDRWITATLFSGSGFFSRRHARHNTFTAHAALSAIHNPNVKLVTGDGWGSFKRIDPRAYGDANLSALSAADAVILTHQHTTCCLEVQAAGIQNKGKIENWLSFISHSPMRRRGLLCVWLTIPASNGIHPNLTNDLLNAGRTPTASVGDPSAGQRIGLASWDEWFDPDGLATDAFGTYQDLFGERRSVFSGWDGCVPERWGNVEDAGNWGWDEVRSVIARDWGLDASAWRLPEYLRGGFYGFTKGMNDGE